MTTPVFDLSAEVNRIRNMYSGDATQGTFNALILGPSGSGKTRLLQTCRLPVLLHSFDPGGSKTVFDMIKSGSIVADTRFETDSAKKPEAYKLWEKEFENLKNANAFQHFGTYCIDSFTTFIDALKNEVARKCGRADGLLQLQDWQVLGNVVKDVLKLCMSLPCDFIVTGHLSSEKDELSGKVVNRIATIPSLQNTLPLLFDEVYMMQADETAKGLERYMLTGNTGRFEAKTRLGSNGKFALKEPPDIKMLLKKAGRSTEDKPAIA